MQPGYLHGLRAQDTFLASMGCGDLIAGRDLPDGDTMLTSAAAAMWCCLPAASACRDMTEELLERDPAHANKTDAADVDLPGHMTTSCRPISPWM